MPNLILEHRNRAQFAELLADDRWLVACLCAAWCDVCRQYQADFERWAALHPDKRFLWIDIEDHADLVGDLDVENFPTLLMQRGDAVAFYGTVMPDTRIADRLLMAQVQRSDEELRAEGSSSAERKGWQRECNLRGRLREALDV